MEKELLQLRNIVESVLPNSMELQGIDVVMGTLQQGQQPSFKAIILVSQKYEDEMGRAGWINELGKRIRAFWDRDELYIEVKQVVVEGGRVS
ncbi:MAG: hypothetical protein NTX84_09495 [Nitrospirae bacterium]|nr:hypothetical protein [Nitrospirota bacterium]